VDQIHLPDFGVFRDAHGYYATRAHETVHWTGTKHRLDRDLAGRFGSNAYAMEELIAELGAAFLCGELGLDSRPRPDHASYIANWLQVLNQDNRAIFTAASKAQQAADWLLQGWSPPAPPPPQAEEVARRAPLVRTYGRRGGGPRHLYI
jgi:antirestriction protein ArdC